MCDVYQKLLHNGSYILVSALVFIASSFARDQLQRYSHPLTLEATSFPAAKERVPGVMKARAVGEVAEYTVNPRTMLT